MATYIEDADQDTKVQTEKNADEDYIRFNTYGYERMVITKGGQVGFGIDPGSSHEIKGVLCNLLGGTVTVNNSTAVAGSGTYFTSIFRVGDAIKINDQVFTVAAVTDDTNLTLDSAYSGYYSGSTCYYNTGLLRIRNGDNTIKFELDRSGRVHIDGSSPKNKLDVGGAAVIGSSYAGVNTAPSNGLLVEGNVGIGTSSPAERLHTYKTGNYTNKLLVEQGTNYGAEIRLKDTVKEWSISENVYVGESLCIRNISDSDTLMTLTATSKVGIGTTNPGRKLFVSGDAGGTTQWYNDSDIELKSNVKTIDNALNKIVKLRGVNFEWKDKENRPKGLQIGLVAQEVKDIIPEVVEKKGEYYSLATANLVALLIEAVKEQQEQIKGLKEEINLIVNKK